MSPRWIRWSGLGAMLGGVCGIVLTLPFAYGSYLWYPGPAAPPVWEPLVRAVFPVDFGSREQVYFTYGRIYFLTLLPQVAGLYALHTVLRDAGGRAERWGFGVSMAGLLLALVGVFTDYWIPAPPGFFAAILGALLMLVGFVLLAVTVRRSSGLPQWIALVLLGAAPLLVPAMLLVYLHAPSGPLLPFHIVWVVLGYYLYAGRRATMPRGHPHERL